MYIEKEQITQSPKEKVQKDKQRATKHYTEKIENTNPTKNWCVKFLLYHIILRNIRRIK